MDSKKNITFKHYIFWLMNLLVKIKVCKRKEKSPQCLKSLLVSCVIDIISTNLNVKIKYLFLFINHLNIKQKTYT